MVSPIPESVLLEKTSLYSPEDFSLLDPARIPEHIAIIMDGNRRWAKDHDFPGIMGHWKGAETLERIVEAASELGVKVLTVYAFSTENWGRDDDEVEGLMNLFKRYLIAQREPMQKKGVRLDSIGDTSRFPQDVKDALEESKQATRLGDKIELVLALNYGGRDDIRRATIAVLEACEKGNISKADITESLFSRYLDTARWPDPELLIRTSGERRLSNFLLWQISYAEVYSTPVLWPDFTEKDLLYAIRDYQKRERRLGSR
jgi:undecaprenyl diphosphate synthase